MLIELVVHLDALGGVVFEKQQKLFGKLKGSRAVGRNDASVGYDLAVHISVGIGVVVATPLFELFDAVAGMFYGVEQPCFGKERGAVADCTYNFTAVDCFFYNGSGCVGHGCHPAEATY